MGKIEIDHTGSGSGITLSSDGTSLLLDGSAIGGGGGSPDLFAESYDGSSTKPSASGSQNAVAIGQGAQASGHDTVAIGEGANANATASLAVGRNAYASGGGGATAVGRDAHASSGTYANAFGHYSYSTGQDAVAIGQARASGTDSLAAVITTNSSSYGAQQQGAIALGKQAKATGSFSVAIGRDSFINSGGADAVAIGKEAEAPSETSMGLGYQSKANVIGCFAFASGGFAGTAGNAQGRMYILRCDTTDATATALTTTNGAASIFNCPRVDSDTVMTFDGVVTATQNGAQAYAGWKVEGLIVSDGGTVSMAASTVTAIQNTPNWGLTVTADDTNNILKITATGEAAHNIRWVANIRTVETTYA